MNPTGSYIHSARNINLKDNILTCELCDVHGTWVLNKKCVYNNTQYDNTNGVLTPANYANSYIITVGNQLGNCLRIITSGIIIAESYNKHVFIYINKDHLLQKELRVIESMFRQYIIYNNVDFDKLEYNNYVTYEKFYGTNYDLICEGVFKPPEQMDKFGITNTIYNIIPENITYEDFIIKKIKIYKSLLYSNPLMDNINNFVKNNNLHNCVGVHMRYTDNLNDHCKRDNNFNTDYNTFITKINSLVNVTIFLCSDNNDIINNVKNNSINNVVVSDLCHDHNFQAFYEMNLLSNCKSIIGTNSSTFSYESAFIKGTNIELYENNEWKNYELEKYR